MSFSQDHLIDEYLAHTDNVRDTAALHLTSFNYGLLGGDDQQKFSDSFRDNSNNEKVELPYCRAITQNGSRIEILNPNWEELNIPLTELIDANNLSTSKFWYVLLIVDPFTRIPEGEEITQESRRKPNTRSAFQFELISLNDLKLDSLANAIPVVKYEAVASGLRKVENYIPPCTRINSHEQLVRKYEIYDNYLTNLKESSKKIIDKIKSKRKSRELNHLAEDIDILCKKYLEHYAISYDEYKLIFRDLPPIKVVAFFARFARVLNHAMDMAFSKSHMLQYFHQYATNISVTQLDSIIKNTFESKYAHYDIADSLAIIDTFLETLDFIFKELVKLDYRELAPIGVVTENKISDVVRTTTPQVEQKRTGERRIRIKHSGREQSLGDHLE